MNRRMRTRMSGGVGGRGLGAPSYPIKNVTYNGCGNTFGIIR